jgi:hypothetical protein
MRTPIVMVEARDCAGRVAVVAYSRDAAVRLKSSESRDYMCRI